MLDKTNEDWLPEWFWDEPQPTPKSRMSSWASAWLQNMASLNRPSQAKPSPTGRLNLPTGPGRPLTQGEIMDYFKESAYVVPTVRPMFSDMEPAFVNTPADRPRPIHAYSLSPELKDVLIKFPPPDLDQPAIRFTVLKQRKPNTLQNPRFDIDALLYLEAQQLAQTTPPESRKEHDDTP